MDFHEFWLQVVGGVVVGLVLTYQQRKIKSFDDLKDKIDALEKREGEFVRWPEHDKAMERLEDKHTLAIERVIDKLDSIQGEMNTNITNLYKLLVEREK